MRGSMILAAVITAIASPVFAQNITGNDCNELAKTIAEEYSLLITSDQSTALKYYASCDATDQSNGVGLSIGYVAFNFGGNFAEAHSSQLCKTQRSALAINDDNYNYSKSVYGPALATIDKCLAYANQGWRVSYLAVGTDAVALTVSNATSSTGGVLLSAAMQPEGGLICDPQLPAGRMDITTIKIFSTVCRRNPKKQLENGVEVVSADDVSIILNFGQGPFVIPFKGYQQLPPPIAALEQKINNVGLQIGGLTLHETLTNTKEPSPTIPGQYYEVTDACPSGTSIVGYFCAVRTGRADLQSAGVRDDNSYYCAWNFIGPWDGKPFSATGQALCLSLKKN